jgi:hypothetical protein
VASSPFVIPGFDMGLDSITLNPAFVTQLPPSISFSGRGIEIHKTTRLLRAKIGS